MTVGQQKAADKIIAVVCTVNDIEASALFSKSWIRETIHARNAAVFALVTFAKLTQKQVGVMIHRDRSSVSHSLICVGEVLDTDDCPMVLQETVNAIRLALGYDVPESKPGKQGPQGVYVVNAKAKNGFANVALLSDHALEQRRTIFDKPMDLQRMTPEQIVRVLG